MTETDTETSNAPLPCFRCGSTRVGWDGIVDDHGDELGPFRCDDCGAAGKVDTYLFARDDWNSYPRAPRS